MSRYKDFRYQIDVKPMDLLEGRYRFFAKVLYLYKDDKKIEHDFWETHGETEEKAKEKMDKKVKKWIEENK